MVECQGEDCGSELNVEDGAENSVKHGLDWIKVVCSNCGRVNQLSQVALSQDGGST